MQGPTATPQAPAIPQASMPSSAPVLQEGYPQAPVANHPSSYQTAPVPQVPVAPYSQPAPQAVSPWDAALQGLYNSSSATPSSPAPGQPWPQTQLAPAPAPAPAGVMAQPQVFQQPVFSSAPYHQPQAAPAQAPLRQWAATPSPLTTAAPAGDRYLDGLSGASLEVLQHFGAEAPALLNHYSCVMEDALLRQAQQTLDLTAQAQQLQQSLRNAHTLITAAAEDNAAYHTILSTPPLLAQYTTEFFGPGGPGELPPAPAEEGPRDRLAAEVAYGESSGRMLPPRSGARAPELIEGYGQYPAGAQIQVQGQGQPQFQAQGQPQFQAQPPAPQTQVPYQRPQLEMRPPGQGGSGGGGEFWETFSYLMDTNPQQAAIYYSQNLTPQALMSRQLMGEN